MPSLVDYLKPIPYRRLLEPILSSEFPLIGQGYDLAANPDKNIK
jgi:hypothetical protein